MRMFCNSPRQALALQAALGRRLRRQIGRPPGTLKRTATRAHWKPGTVRGTALGCLGRAVRPKHQHACRGNVVP